LAIFHWLLAIQFSAASRNRFTCHAFRPGH
jgi:hypothetical protein